MQIMAASKKPMLTWNAADLSLEENELGYNGALNEILRSMVSSGERKRIIFQGDAKEVALKLTKVLQQDGVLKVA
jgi:electron transfer flavoprotein alpha/beta subunit